MKADMDEQFSITERISNVSLIQKTNAYGHLIDSFFYTRLHRYATDPKWLIRPPTNKFARGLYVAPI